jgi:hypothetical protein
MKRYEGMVPNNPHSPMSLMFEVNADGHVFGAPRDAFFIPHDQFHDGPVGGDDGVRRLLEMVVAAVMQ